MPVPLFAFLLALIGVASGVAINLLLDVVSPQPLKSSYLVCQACGRRYGLRRLMPLMGHLWGGGKCEKCDAGMSRRPLLVEVSAGLLFGLLAWRFDWDVQLWTYMLFSAVLIVVFVVEMEHQLVLDIVSYPAIAAAFVLSWFVKGLGPLRAVVGAVFGAFTMGLPFLAYRRRGMFGLGDVVLGVLLGLMVGWPQIVFVLAVAAVSAAVVAVFLVVGMGRKRTDIMPFGPFLAGATVMAFFFGQSVTDWVLARMPF